MYRYLMFVMAGVSILAMFIWMGATAIFSDAPHPVIGDTIGSNIGLAFIAVGTTLLILWAEGLEYQQKWGFLTPQKVESWKALCLICCQAVVVGFVMRSAADSSETIFLIAFVAFQVLFIGAFNAKHDLWEAFATVIGSAIVSASSLIAFRLLFAGYSPVDPVILIVLGSLSAHFSRLYLVHWKAYEEAKPTTIWSSRGRKTD